MAIPTCSPAATPCVSRDLVIGSDILDGEGAHFVVLIIFVVLLIIYFFQFVHLILS